MKKTLVAAGLAAVVALGTHVTVSGPSHAADPQVVTISGAGPQGRWFQLANIYANLLNKEVEGTKFNGVTGRGVSIGNLKRVNAGQVEGGFVHFYHIADARNKAGEFKDDDTDYSNALVWFAVDRNMVRVIADARIKSIAELKGKRVSIGDRGSGDDEQCRLLLKYHGITDDNASLVYTSREAGSDGLANRQLDAICNSYTRNNRGHLQPIFSARELGSEVEFLSPDEAVLQKLVTENPQFVIDREGEPVFERPDLIGMAYEQGAILSANLSEDLVYRMTKAVFENWPLVQEQAPYMKEHDGADKGASITFTPYHPGAIKYFREVGAWQKSHGS